MFHVKHRKDGIMKLKELYWVCDNFNHLARLNVITSEESYVAMLDDVFR